MFKMDYQNYISKISLKLVDISNMRVYNTNVRVLKKLSLQIVLFKEADIVCKKAPLDFGSVSLMKLLFETSNLKSFDVHTICVLIVYWSVFVEIEKQIVLRAILM